MQEPFERGAGVLLPISSLPSPYGIGTFGKAAYEFVDTLSGAGQHYWQVLPIGPTSYGDSPYQSYSAFAGNPYFIDLDTLVEEGLLSREEIGAYQWSDTDAYVSYDRIYEGRFAVLYLAYGRSRHQETEDYQQFCAENDDLWLKDFALYCALKKYYDQKPWTEWEDDAKFRNPAFLAEMTDQLADEIGFQKFMQYKFREQWTKLKAYANEKHIEIIGDIPLYMAMDSADVWANPKQYKLDDDLNPTFVAGCPPDCFSATGQLWGNPIYLWSAHEADGFRWWKARMKANASLYDVIRIDHFIGIVRYFNIPAGDTDATGGHFEWGPGKKLCDAIDEAIGDKKIIAEDLGLMIPEVRSLLAQTGYPGMKVLQFAFDGKMDNDHLPFNYGNNLVVYSGTHDNETLVGFYRSQPDSVKAQMLKYLNVSNPYDLCFKMARCLMSSTAAVCIIPAQDLLGLGNEARINTPSTLGDNWKWRLTPGQLTLRTFYELNIPDITEIYGRKYEEPQEEAEEETAAE